MDGLAGAASCLIRRHDSQRGIIGGSPEVACQAGVTLSGACARCALRSEVNEAVLANIIIVDEPKVLAVLLVKYLRSNDHGAGREQYRKDTKGLHS